MASGLVDKVFLNELNCHDQTPVNKLIPVCFIIAVHFISLHSSVLVSIFGDYPLSSDFGKKVKKVADFN